MAENFEDHNSRGEESSFTEVLVTINKVSKVLKGGRKFSFAAIVVVGDKKGRVGVGTGKAVEVADARKKATESAKKNLRRFPMKDGRTIHHDAEGRSGAGKVIIRSAKAGTGIIAGGPMRAIFACLGVHDVVAKSIGSSSPHNMIAATLDALSKLNSPKSVATRRNKLVADIVQKRHSEFATAE